ncbi:hypothetical protein [Comamonas terrigena]|uniref:hypothetical protein n=1 Tax=Comamonas terrigena TaxID=32013 RepID=UPI0024473D3E|nr:hypothetical protein [Comamonas terrigena]MDH0051038.1 hypothetical protein [Comamonas terrigena]MDH0513473.1 hypothetical protein [Comamonas terrigena]MDH1092983.1 hypothetical protein [Comamonas terrigena]
MVQKVNGNDARLRQFLRENYGPNRQVYERLGPLNQLLAARPASDYQRIINAFKTAAPITYRNLTALGTKNAWDLVRQREPFPTLELSNTLLLASVWLRNHSAKINEFRLFSTQIENLIISGNELEALAKLDAFIKLHGWSLWAVEIRAALLQATEGTASLRAWLSGLQERASNSIPGLLFQVYGDRNDETFSYEAIVGKCQSSFPRFEGFAPWLLDYLYYRAIGHLTEPGKALAGILSREISSCLLDYYEGIIECLTNLETDESLAHLKPVGLTLIKTLLENGYVDTRLSKMLFLLSDGDVKPVLVESPESPSWLGYVSGEQACSESQGKFREVCLELAEARNQGAAAYVVVGELLKWGINHKVLDVGAAVAGIGLCACTSLSDRPRPLSISISHESVIFEDVATCNPSTAMTILRCAFPIQGSQAVDLKEILVSVGTAELLLRYPKVGMAHLWWANKLKEFGLYEELKPLIIWLKRHAGLWERKATIIEVELLCADEDLEGVLSTTVEWFRADYRHAYEFNCQAIFEGRNWRVWKQLDPVKVATVAHCAFVATSTPSIAYICKMACRAYLESGKRDAVVDDYESGTDERKALLVTFLRDVWIEENLSMCHRFQSTDEVHIERMRILQLLISWDSSNESEYAEAIKELTFDQTMQRGLEQINRTRVFVNESAITRWAEKEVAQDYDRWLRLVESNAGSREVDDILRQYALNPSNDQTLAAFSKGKPTAADAMLMDMVDRLYQRFLSDPTDGLDTFLSLRIRHGSFKGTLLGPFEEQGLLFGTGSSFSNEAFSERWNDALRLAPIEMEGLASEFQKFSIDVRKYIDDFVNERIQIARSNKPYGAFQAQILPLSARILAAGLAERPTTFVAFLSTAYFVFWKLVELSLSELRTDILDNLSAQIRTRIEQLIHEVRARGPKCLSLVTTLTTVSTTIISQCERVSEWFRLPNAIKGENVELNDAIDIATATTRNVYRAFGADVAVKSLPSVRLPLTTTALATITDCLFVAFENAWKHSGLSSALHTVTVEAFFDDTPKVLTLCVRSEISEERRIELIDGKLDRLRHKYLGELPLDLISIEGGSGFPKLSRLSRSVPKEVNDKPFNFGVDEQGWWTMVSFPLYEREGVYEVYE